MKCPECGSPVTLQADYNLELRVSCMNEELIPDKRTTSGHRMACGWVSGVIDLWGHRSQFRVLLDEWLAQVEYDTVFDGGHAKTREIES